MVFKGYSIAHDRKARLTLHKWCLIITNLSCQLAGGKDTFQLISKDCCDKCVPGSWAATDFRS